MKSYSQSYQDLFALKTAVTKTYIEIGAQRPVDLSNTYNLELDGWKGFSLEINAKKRNWTAWNECKERKNKLYWEDALLFDYVDASNENNLKHHFGYLSCDIDPPINTFTALVRVIEQGISFDCITFEHDAYRSTENFDIRAREFLSSKGYKVAVTGVYPYSEKHNHFETWFVNDKIEYETKTFDEWKEQNL